MEVVYIFAIKCSSQNIFTDNVPMYFYCCMSDDLEMRVQINMSDCSVKVLRCINNLPRFYGSVQQTTLVDIII